MVRLDLTRDLIVMFLPLQSLDLSFCKDNTFLSDLLFKSFKPIFEA